MKIPKKQNFKTSGPNIQHSEDDIAKVLQKFKGLQYLSAEFLGICQSTLSERISGSPYLTKVRDDCVQKRIDIAELNLAELNEEKNLGAICFLLKTKGKSRGYSENQVQPPVTLDDFRRMQAFIDQITQMQAKTITADASESPAADPSQ
jgi:hypothetical protein